jgi:deazaflavin-dependent oxidoreductase (nitroreductase family)
MSTPLPPRWIITTIWRAHRLLYRVTGGKAVLARPTPGGKFGTMRLTTTGRQSGESRGAILGYIESGADLVTLAMNGWGATPPAWWLNLEAQPEAHVHVVGEHRAVRARPASGEERERLWAEVRGYDGYGDQDAFAASRPVETIVVVLEPR